MNVAFNNERGCSQSFKCQVFDVTYFGVEESRSSALKHCQDALHALINRAKKNGRKMRTCQAKICVDSMEIHFPPDAKQVQFCIVFDTR